MDLIRRKANTPFENCFSDVSHWSRFRRFIVKGWSISSRVLTLVSTLVSHSKTQWQVGKCFTQHHCRARWCCWVVDPAGNIERELPMHQPHCQYHTVPVIKLAFANYAYMKFALLFCKNINRRWCGPISGYWPKEQYSALVSWSFMGTGTLADPLLLLIALGLSNISLGLEGSIPFPRALAVIGDVNTG